jgi:hypothetical protein
VEAARSSWWYCVVCNSCCFEVVWIYKGLLI